MADFYQSNPSTGVAGLGQQPTLQQLLSSLSAARPAASQPAATSAATPSASAPTVAGPMATGLGAGGQGTPGTGPNSDNGIAGAAQSFAGRNTAVNPSLGNSLKLAGMIPGFSPIGALATIGGVATGLTNNPFTGAQLGPALSPADQDAVAKAYMAGGPVAATTALNAARARAMTAAAGMQTATGAIDPATGQPMGGAKPAGATPSGGIAGLGAAGDPTTGQGATPGNYGGGNGQNAGGSGAPGGGGLAGGAAGRGGAAAF